jgi:hypothetical protein
VPHRSIVEAPIRQRVDLVQVRDRVRHTDPPIPAGRVAILAL